MKGKPNLSTAAKQKMRWRMNTIEKGRATLIMYNNYHAYVHNLAVWGKGKPRRTSSGPELEELE